jgi:hypothetical protein
VRVVAFQGLPMERTSFKRAIVCRRYTRDVISEQAKARKLGARRCRDALVRAAQMHAVTKCACLKWGQQCWRPGRDLEGNGTPVTEILAQRSCEVSSSRVPAVRRPHGRPTLAARSRAHVKRLHVPHPPLPKRQRLSRDWPKPLRTRTVDGCL